MDRLTKNALLLFLKRRADKDNKGRNYA